MNKFIKIIFLSLVTISSFESYSTEFSVNTIKRLSDLSQPADPSKVNLLVSRKQSDLARYMSRHVDWIPGPIRREVDLQISSGFVVSATRFTITRSESTLSSRHLLDSTDISRICKCSLSRFQKKSASSIQFDSATTRLGNTVSSVNYIKYYSKNQFSQLPMGQKFLSHFFQISNSIDGYATFQVSYNMDKIFKSTIVYSYYFAKANGEVDIISVTLSLFKDNVKGVNKMVVAEVIRRDAPRIARQASLNGG